MMVPEIGPMTLHTAPCGVFPSSPVISVTFMPKYDVKNERGS